MIIKDWGEKIKAYGEKFQKVEPAVLIILLVVLSSSLIFGLGWWYQIEASRTPVRIYQAGNSDAPSGAGQVVASKNGTKYYYGWCGGSKTIKEANRVTFATEALAIQAGYSKAKNCQ